MYCGASKHRTYQDASTDYNRRKSGINAEAFTEAYAENGNVYSLGLKHISLIGPPMHTRGVSNKRVNLTN